MKSYASAGSRLSQFSSIVSKYSSVTTIADDPSERKIKLMNRELGTTFILASSSDTNLKKLASVLIYLDNGHISKIRSGLFTKPSRQTRSKKKRYSKHRTKKPNYRSKV